MEGLRQNGVVFANNGGSNAIGVAETTIMLMLGVCKNMFELALMARSGAKHRHCSIFSGDFSAQLFRGDFGLILSGVWTEHHTRLNVRGAPGARELTGQTIGIGK